MANAGRLPTCCSNTNHNREIQTTFAGPHQDSGPLLDTEDPGGKDEQCIIDAVDPGGAIKLAVLDPGNSLLDVVTASRPDSTPDAATVPLLASLCAFKSVHSVTESMQAETPEYLCPVTFNKRPAMTARRYCS